MVPSAPVIAPTGSVPSFERFSKSVIRMKNEPTMKAVMIARIGMIAGLRAPAERLTPHRPSASPASRRSPPGPPGSPTMLPPSITATRSPTASTSSSSVLTMRTAAPASRCSTIRLWMYSIDPTSRPRVGWAATTSLTGRRELAGDDDLLLVAARERPGVGVDRRRPHVVVLHARSPRPRAMASALSLPRLLYGSRWYVSRMKFSATVIAPIRPSRIRSSGTWATPRSETWRGDDVVVVVAVDDDLARVDRPEADDRLDELGLAVALDARERDDLARPDLEADALDRHVLPVVPHVEVLDGRARRRPATPGP